uniref:UAA transporter family protein n=1 Tax=Wuchereria bancrofti TaxID=6293 RepID=A0A1I8EBA8_WUCBA
GYARIVFIFFVVNDSNNLALRYNVSIPLFIIFHTGTLLANVLLGFCLRNRICSLGKLLSIMFVSVGVVLFTLADQFSKHPIIEKDGKSVHPLSILHFNPGIFLLIFATLLSAYLGICQEDLYCTYGDHSQEGIFFIMDMYYKCTYTYFADYIAECCNGYNTKEILIDVILFKNPFTFMHCIGCLLVLLGTIAFTLCDFKFMFAQKKSV